MDKESLEHLLARGASIEKIAKRFGKHPSTVSYWMAKHCLEAPHRDKHRSKGRIERDRLEALVTDGMTMAEIAAEIGLSKATVRYWLRRYGLRTSHSRGRRSATEVCAMKEAGLLFVTMTCTQHGETEFILEGRGRYRCRRCRSEAVSRRRRKVKRILVAEAGGECILCGYRRHIGALHFHHVEPIKKRVEINAKGVALALDKLRIEAAKCVLLCPNCHAEVEEGIASLPDTVSRHNIRCPDP